MLKKGLFAGGVGLLLLALVFGRNVYSYVATSVGWVQQSVKSNVPVEFELQRARQMIAALEPEIRTHKQQIAREELELERFHQNLKGEEDGLTKKWTEIERLRADLGHGDSNFVYAGHTYTAKQVESDLSNRFDRYQTKEATVDKLKKIVEARKKGLAAAQDKLKALIASKRQLEVEVENLEARLKMVEVAKATSQLNIDDSQLARTRDLLKDIEARIEVDAQLANAEDVVLDEIPLADSTEKGSILDRIAAYQKVKGAADKAEAYVAEHKAGK
jgi:chromosome segregation ATPase